MIGLAILFCLGFVGCLYLGILWAVALVHGQDPVE